MKRIISHIFTMRIVILATMMTMTATAMQALPDSVLKSPNKRLTISMIHEGFSINYMDKPVTVCKVLGVITQHNQQPNKGGDNQIPVLKERKDIHVHYQMLTGKKQMCDNEAHEAVYAISSQIRLRLRAYNDGVAFRYELSGLKDDQMKDELTTYFIREGQRRWIQKYTQPYEEYFPMTTSGISSDNQTNRPNNHWGYPALTEIDKGIFALFTESDIHRNQSASSLTNNGELYQVQPDRNPSLLNGNWNTPWRVIIIGKLNEVVQSTLVTDLAEPSKIQDTSWIHPGVAAWIYWAYNHGSNDYQIVKRYIDMAHRLHLPYVLIDAEWDEMKNGGNIDDAITYAHQQGIKPILWYNSTTAWINGAAGPKYRLNDADKREQEFSLLEKKGVAGVKIDFFEGDTQPTMAYCIDLLECAARHHLLVNFHGATIPRGWQRTYPNLITTEGVYGEEWYNNLPVLTDKAARHNATLPFTRNVVGPMDYTPCAFSDSQHPHITTHAHELALTVLFESGIQHLADKPESYYAQPQAVQDFLGTLPTAWDETKLFSGYPGEYVVMARRKGSTWYIAGINGTDSVKSITMPKVDGLITSFEDSGDKEHPWKIRQNEKKTLPQQVKCLPRGGFIFIIKETAQSHK
jgi:hypothetical protein